MKRFTTLLASIILLNMTILAQNKVSLVTADSQGVTIKFSFIEYQLNSVSTTKGLAKTVAASNCYPLMQKGMPEVLRMSTSIALPNTGSFTTNIVSEKHNDFQSLLIAPSKGNLLRNVNPETIPYSFSSGYQRNEFFPKNIIKANTPYIARSVRGCALDANVMQYNPITKTLRIYSEIIVRVNFTNKVGENELTHAKPIDSEFQKIYQRQFINFNPSKYTAVSETGELLIICYDNFMTAMQPFVNHKLSMGVPTTMVAGSVAGTTPTQIKAYINNVYSTRNLKYVLLVGDYAQVTTTMLNTSGGLGGSDNTYSFLAGNDHYPDIFVGRFSAETVEHVNTMVQRTILYENNPTAGNWPITGLGIASDQGPGDNSEYDYQHIRNIRTSLMNYGYTNVAEEYDGNQGGVDAVANASATNVGNLINQGLGVITYCGHGDWNMFVSSGFNNTNVDALQNTTKWPFIFSVACVNGNFTSQTCFAEHWLRATYNGQPAGALATIMSTINQAWNPPMKGQDEMVKILTESYSSNIKRTYGGITMNAMMSMLDAYSTDGTETMDTWNIFGDPSVMVRTAVATPLMVSHPSQTPVGTTSITLTSAVEGARIALKLNETLLGVGTISGGTVTINVAPLSTIDTIDVIGSAYNKIPYHGIIVINNSIAPYVSLSTIGLNDISGNNNQLADYGDTILLNTTLKNLGLAQATNVSATISNPGVYTQILDNTQIFGNIAIADSVKINGAFKIAIANNVPDQTSQLFTLNITDGTNLWNSYYTLLMNAPKIKNLPLVVNDGTASNPNGALDPGEQVILSVPVMNQGHSACNNSTALISTTSTDVIITNPIVTLGVLNASATLPAQFDVQVNPTAPINSNVTFQIISGCGAYKDTTMYYLRIGAIVEDWESNTFTRYMWTNDATYPWTIVSSSPQEGTYCAQSGAISNSQSSTLQMTINVANNDSISFWYKVSSENTYDFLRFYIGNAKKAEWSGEKSWARASYPVSQGSKILKWIYIKDEMELAGSDCAWIDFINLPKAVSEIGIETQTVDVNYSVFPNPAKDLINVNVLSNKADDVQISLIDLTGKILSQSMLQLNGNIPNTAQFSISNYSNGVYFVKINSSTIQKTIKVAIVK